MLKQYNFELSSSILFKCCMIDLFILKIRVSKNQMNLNTKQVVCDIVI